MDMENAVKLAEASLTTPRPEILQSRTCERNAEKTSSSAESSFVDEKCTIQTPLPYRKSSSNTSANEIEIEIDQATEKRDDEKSLYDSSRQDNKLRSSRKMR